eukprot:scaffold8227_cov72-Phaeocystis_antarctica.AAC.9
MLRQGRLLSVHHELVVVERPTLGLRLANDRIVARGWPLDVELALEIAEGLASGDRRHEHRAPPSVTRGSTAHALRAAGVVVRLTRGRREVCQGAPTAS